jgi:hypothetical protein
MIPSSLRLLAITSLLLGGCSAAKKPVVKVVVPRQCIVEVHLTDKTECSGPEGKPMQCTKLELVFIKGCSTLQVPPIKKGDSH